MPESRLTTIDWQLLELLQNNSRATISSLSKKLGRSRSNINERIERLQANGVLTAMTLQTDEEKLGFGISAFVRIQASSKNHRLIIKRINELPEVAECHVLTGKELVILRVVAKDMVHLRNLVDSFTQFGSTQTDVIFSTVKSKLKINNALMKKIKRD